MTAILIRQVWKLHIWKMFNKKVMVTYIKFKGQSERAVHISLREKEKMHMEKYKYNLKIKTQILMIVLIMLMLPILFITSIV